MESLDETANHSSAEDNPTCPSASGCKPNGCTVKGVEVHACPRTRPLISYKLEECALCQILCRPSGACVRRTGEPTANAMGYVLTALRASGVRLSC